MSAYVSVGMWVYRCMYVCVCECGSVWEKAFFYINFKKNKVEEMKNSPWLEEHHCKDNTPLKNLQASNNLSKFRLGFVEPDKLSLKLI